MIFLTLASVEHFKIQQLDFNNYPVRNGHNLIVTATAQSGEKMQARLQLVLFFLLQKCISRYLAMVYCFAISREILQKSSQLAIYHCSIEKLPQSALCLILLSATSVTQTHSVILAILCR